MGKVYVGDRGARKAARDLREAEREATRKAYGHIRPAFGGFSNTLNSVGRRILPERGGLAGEILRNPGLRYDEDPRGRVVSMSAILTHRYHIEGIEDGLVIHPFFGEPPWYRQRTIPRFFATCVKINQARVEQVVWRTSENYVKVD